MLYNIFNIVEGLEDVPFDIRRVFPTKQREVVTIYKLLCIMETITDEWIFGSSVNSSCYYYSDTDVLVRIDESLENSSIQVNILRYYLMDICKHGFDLFAHDLDTDTLNRFIRFGKGLKIK